MPDPALVAEVERLRGQVARLRRALLDEKERAVNDRRRLLARLEPPEGKELIRMALGDTIRAAGGTVIDHADQRTNQHS
jgi:hypothetical protein